MYKSCIQIKSLREPGTSPEGTTHPGEVLLFLLQKPDLSAEHISKKGYPCQGKSQHQCSLVWTPFAHVQYTQKLSAASIRLLFWPGSAGERLTAYKQFTRGRIEGGGGVWGKGGGRELQIVSAWFNDNVLLCCSTDILIIPAVII